MLDATNGQNAIAQAQQFKEAVGITGIVLTKLDGTAKGGVILGICDELRSRCATWASASAWTDLREFDRRRVRRGARSAQAQKRPRPRLKPTQRVADFVLISGICA